MGERESTDHVLVQQALLLYRFPQVSLELLVVRDSAGVVRWGDVLGHGAQVYISQAVEGQMVERYRPTEIRVRVSVAALKRVFSATTLALLHFKLSSVYFLPSLQLFDKNFSYFHLHEINSPKPTHCASCRPG